MKYKDIIDILYSLNLSSDKNLGTCSNGQWVMTNKPYDHSVNPSTNKNISTVNFLNNDEDILNDVLDSAHNTFLEWRKVPAPARGEMIRQIGDELRKNKETLGALISLETGKILQEGLGEVQEAIDVADFAVGQSRMMYGKTMHSERPQHRMYEQWHPLGVVTIISAFNFPVAVWAWNALLAAVCGNTIVWKPSPKAPLCSIAIQHICNRVMRKNGYLGVFNLINSSNPELIESTITDKRVQLVSFTGSCEIGKKVAVLTAEYFKKTILELGGNNAIILDTDANLKLAIPAIVFGATGTAGQRCTSTRRVFVHEDQIDTVVGKLLKAYEQVLIGDPLNEKVLMGPLIDRQAVNNFFETINRATKVGGILLTGGHALHQGGNFVEPTIILAKHDMDIIQEETFAPILYIIPYETLDEAITMHNDVPQGLSSAIFTNSVQSAEKFLSVVGSDTGIANVNIGTSGAEIGGSFGGEKNTGGGRESGGDSWQQYMRLQTNTINWSDELPLAQGIKFEV